ncbi:hypothetical protein Q2K19_03665 [Micromonospora soli]|uniref:hypothetical protein n=1 Tax=Micromonospora sp. NBRC 110009 TaxID=3061627 RepID=UPI00267395DF|nr:hypothetical protein [Micromonospora sp. NBRC 110009]WKT99612.1 hypothetical protein Q2K19_03665 [Micromonospora sp. NBRC 110009]
MPDVVLSKRGRYAALKRRHGADHPTTQAASRELREATLARHITRLVDQAPPLTDEQRARLAGLLRPAGGQAGEAA